MMGLCKWLCFKELRYSMSKNVGILFRKLLIITQLQSPILVANVAKFWKSLRGYYLLFYSEYEE